VSVVLVSFTPGLGYPSFGYSLWADLLKSQDSVGNLYSSGYYDVTLSAEASQPADDGFSYWTTVHVGSLPGYITDSARFLVSAPYFSHGFGGVVGELTANRPSCMMKPSPKWQLLLTL
jgi:hypothetical protein